MMCSAIRPRAKAATGPRCSSGRSSHASRSSFSAAAGLVVKPATPPNGIKSGIAVTGTKLASPPCTGSTKLHDAQTKQEEKVPQELAAERIRHAQAKQEEDVPQELATEKRCVQALVEVRCLSGESIVKANFQSSDRVLSVKERVRKTQEIPLWQQMLSFQGEMLDDQSTLGELSLLQGGVFDLVLRPGPTAEDMEAFTDAAREVLTAGTEGMGSVAKRDVMEVKAFSKPPMVCEKICLATLHMLAGLVPQIPIKRNGSPKDADWSGCKVMMANPSTFLKQVLELPSCIDQGRVMEDHIAKCRQLIDAIDGDSESEKIQYVARCSLMCQQLVRFLIGVLKYSDSVSELRQRFGGASITELKSHQ